MLSKCANPGCSTAFRYLREGKLFEIQSTDEPSSASGKKPVRRVEFFWLCGQCSTALTVVKNEEKGVDIVPIPATTPFLIRRAAAS